MPSNHSRSSGVLETLLSSLQLYTITKMYDLSSRSVSLIVLKHGTCSVGTATNACEDESGDGEFNLSQQMSKSSGTEVKQSGRNEATAGRCAAQGGCFLKRGYSDPGPTTEETHKNR